MIYYHCNVISLLSCGMSESKSVSQTQVRESADISIEILSSVELHQALVYLLFLPTFKLIYNAYTTSNKIPNIKSKVNKKK